MAFILMSSVLGALFLANPAVSIQVSSNSPCASLCLDNPTQNTTDPTISNTHASEITCVDSDYANSPVGEKFMSCVSCLQNSTASDDNGSDQEWFLYNLRFATDSCLFGFLNASDPVPNPCATSGTCGPLQTALENGNLLLSNESEFSYCSADNSAFLGSYLSKCKECVTQSSNEKYLGNFLTALQAGCLQQPPTGTIIGIEGNVFSTTPITITYPGDNQAPSAAPTSKHQNGLTQAGIIGIVVTIAVLLMISMALLFICYRRHHNIYRMKQLKSPLDSRFGAPNITSPTNGAYGNPYSNPPVSVKSPSDPSQYSKHSSPKDMQEPGWIDAQALLGGQLTPKSGTSIASIPTHQAYIPSQLSPPLSEGSEIHRLSPQYPSTRSTPKKPTPPPLNLQQQKQTSPWQRQECVQVQQPPPVAAPQNSPPRIYPSAPPVFEYRPLFGDDGPPVIERPPSRSPAAHGSPDYLPPSRNHSAQASPEYRPPSRTQTNPSPEYSPPARAGSRAESRPRAGSRNRGFPSLESESSRIYPSIPHSQSNHVSPEFRAPSRTQTIPLPEYSPPSRTGSRTENRLRTRGFPSPESESSRVYPPVSHSQSANVSPEILPPSRTQTVPVPEYSPPSRAGSRAESRPRGESRTRGFPSPESGSSRISPPGLHSQQQPLETRPPSRIRSRTEAWRRVTGRTGVGNSIASIEIPIHISGPMIKHGGRFDFELAERDRMEKEQREGKQPEIKRLKKEDATPDSAVSADLWPGSY